MILPPVQFLLFFFILLRPSFIPEELYCSMQAYVMNLAPMRFTQPCIMMPGALEAVENPWRFWMAFPLITMNS